MNPRPIPRDAAVCLHSVNKTFPCRPGLANWFRREQAITALSDISLHVSRGQIVALMGPNGSGKSTLLRLVAATLLPESGRVVVLGFDTAARPLAVRRRVGLAVAQERSFFPRLTAWDNLCFFASLDDVPPRRCRQQVESVLDQCGLADWRDRCVHQFSSGMYQRLAIARALLKQPSVLLLDEPTRSADPDTARFLRQLMRALAAAGVTLLLATHNFEEAAALADAAVFLSQGKIADRLRRPDSAQLRSAYARLSPQAAPVLETQWEACYT